MKFESAIEIIDAELRKFSKAGCGRRAAKKESATTRSVYYVIDNGCDCLAFRVSDHPTKKSSISTLDMSYGNNTYETVYRFVSNKIAALSKRSFDRAMGFSTKKNWENNAESAELMTGAISL